MPVLEEVVVVPSCVTGASWLSRSFRRDIYWLQPLLVSASRGWTGRLHYNIGWRASWIARSTPLLPWWSSWSHVGRDEQLWILINSSWYRGGRKRMSKDRSTSMWQSHKVVLGVGQSGNTYAPPRPSYGARCVAPAETPPAEAPAAETPAAETPAADRPSPTSIFTFCLLAGLASDDVAPNVGSYPRSATVAAA